MRKTHRQRKTHRRRKTHRGGRGGMGGISGSTYGRPFTSGASQELYQLTGRTPGLSSGGGGGKKQKMRKAAKLAAEAARLEAKAEMMEAKAEMMEEKAEMMNEKAKHMLRANAPEWQPSKNLLLNMAMKKRENELIKMMNENNNHN